MSISMKNMSDRITALENKINSGALGGWEKGSNSNGYWLKEKSTGIIIQFGKIYARHDQDVVVTLPTSFSNTEYFADANEIRNGKDGNSICLPGNKQNNKFTLYNYVLSNWIFWFAIGYLISYRILNYIYKGIMHFLCGKKLKNFWFKQRRCKIKMSISLNDHERRIKALEDKTNGKKYDVLFRNPDGSVNVTPGVSITLLDGKSLHDYDIVVFEVFYRKTWEISSFHHMLAFGRQLTRNAGAKTNYWLTCVYSKYGLELDIVPSEDGRSFEVDKMTSDRNLYAIYGLKIYYIFRYNIYNKFILRINSTFDNFVNIFTSFDLFGSFERSVLRLTNHFTSQNEFYYLREVNYDMEIKSNILYYKILVLCYILLKQIFVCFSLLVDMEFYFYHFIGGEKI